MASCLEAAGSLIQNRDAPRQKVYTLSHHQCRIPDFGVHHGLLVGVSNCSTVPPRLGNQRLWYVQLCLCDWADPLSLIENRRASCPGGRFPSSFIHQVIIITGLNNLYMPVCSRSEDDLRCRQGVKPPLKLCQCKQEHRRMHCLHVDILQVVQSN